MGSLRHVTCSQSHGCIEELGQYRTVQARPADRSALARMKPASLNMLTV